MTPEEQQARIEVLLEENNQLIKENQSMLKRVQRSLTWGFWLRIVWYVVLIGLPFALYFYLLEPYFNALGSSYETFSTGLQEIPGWKQFDTIFNAEKNSF